MADTSELRRICHEMLNGVPTGDETLGHIKDCCTLARWVESRLQAEAQAPTTLDPDAARKAYWDRHYGVTEGDTP